MRSVATARAATHRAFPASQLAVLADAQHIAAEAGYWLAADGRPAAAATVLEYSRAVLLTRLAGGLEPASGPDWWRVSASRRTCWPPTSMR